MHSDDRLRPRRDCGLNRLSCNVLAVTIDVNAYRTGPAHNGATGRRDKCPGCRYDFVARADSRYLQRQFQRKRAIRQTDGVFRAAELSKFEFELAPLFTSPIVDFP